MLTHPSQAPMLKPVSGNGPHSMALKFVWADQLGSIAQAVIATVEDKNGEALKQFTLLGPFTATGAARDAAIRKATDWLNLKSQ